MKFTKTQMLSLFLTGTMLFSGVAIADTLIGSGYSGAKEALKRTTKTLVKNTDSFTLSTYVEAKFDGELLSSEQAVEKFDVKNNKVTLQNITYTKENGSFENYKYSDEEKVIHKWSGEEVYHQTNRHNAARESVIEDPFEDKYAEDIEKVADAFVSGMKDFVQIKEENGGKLYFGNLDGSQMPAFVSALSGVLIKYSVIDTYRMRELGVENTKDVYVTEVYAKVFENANGILENAMATAKAVSVDENGREYAWEFSISTELSDINKTIVKEPEMNGKVEISSEHNSRRYGQMLERDIGRYKGDIVEKTEDEYIKKGTAELNITAVGEEEISGHITISEEKLKIDTDFTAGFNGYYSEYIAEIKVGEATRYLSFSNCKAGQKLSASITMEANIKEMRDSGQGKVYYDKDVGLHEIMMYKIFE